MGFVDPTAMATFADEARSEGFRFHRQAWCRARRDEAADRRGEADRRVRLGAGELLLDQPGEEAGAERQGLVVEIVAGIVHLAAALAVAIADLDVGAGPRSSMYEKSSDAMVSGRRCG